MEDFGWPLVHWVEADADAEDRAILRSCLVASKEPPEEVGVNGRVKVGGVRWDRLRLGTVMGTAEVWLRPLGDAWVDGQRFSSGRGFFGTAGEELGCGCLEGNGCCGMLI